MIKYGITFILILIFFSGPALAQTNNATDIDQLLNHLGYPQTTDLIATHY